MKIWKRLTSMMLVVLMVMSLMTGILPVYAEEGSSNEDTTEATLIVDEVTSESEEVLTSDSEEELTLEPSEVETTVSEPAEEPASETTEATEDVVATESNEEVETTDTVEEVQEDTKEDLDPVVVPVAEDKDDDKKESNWRDANLFVLVDGRFAPYNPITGEVVYSSSTRAKPTGIHYSNTFGGHANDLNGNVVKAGGRYDSWKWGSNQWWPASTGVVAQTGYRVCTYNVWCQDGPIYYSSMGGTPLAIPIRVSMETGWSEYGPDGNYLGGYGPYTQQGTGVPPFKLESLYTNLVPTFTTEMFRDVSLIYGVARGMGGMTESGTANITAAGTTLIMSRIWGYIGVGSDKVFHGTPMGTSSSAVNKQMGEIIARCNVYTKEKGITGSKTGDNTLTSIVNKVGAVTNTTGWFVKSGTADANHVHWFFINKSQSSGNQEYIWMNNVITFDNTIGYSLKKTSSGTSADNAIINGNPMYSLAGAKYEIHKDSATGTVVETLTTDANGNATGTKKYAVGTVLYAVETVAPKGYEINSTPVKLTLTTTASNNVFNVTDKPSFDPLRLKITKTNDSSTKLQGAVFEVKYYASTWADDNQLKKTWYFKSDSNGVVRFDANHLTSFNGHNSDTLYTKSDGGPVLPLGCAVVKEVQAPAGYVLPSGYDGRLFFFVTQGGGKTPVNGAKAKGYWGDGSGSPITTQSAYGIFKLTNNSDLQELTGVNEPDQVPVTLLKVSVKPSGVSDEEYALINGNSNYSLVGAKFDYYINGTKIGNIELTNADGTLAIPGRYDKGTKVKVKETYAPKGYKLNPNFSTEVTLNGNTEHDKVTLSDEPVFGKLPELVKYDVENENEKLAGAVFKYSYYKSNTATGTPAKVWYFKTDADGKIIPNAAHLASGYTSDGILSNIALGCVTVEEVKAPANYEFAEGVSASYKELWLITQTSSGGNAESAWKSNGSRPAVIYYVSNEEGAMDWGNAPIKKKVTVSKVTTNSPEGIAALIVDNNAYTLKNTKFKLTADGYDDEFLTVNESGTATSAQTYRIGTVVTVEEIIAPKGYYIPTNHTKTVTVTENGTNSVELADPPVFGDVPSIIKLDEFSGDSLGGAVFTVKYYPGTSTTAKYTWEFTSDSDGKVVFNVPEFTVNGKTYVPLGVFEITEKSAPANYLVTEGSAYYRIYQVESGEKAVKYEWVKSLTDYTVTNKYNAYVNIDPNGTLMWKDERESREVRVLKVTTNEYKDLVKDNPLYSLSNAEFAIYGAKKDGTMDDSVVLDTITTDANGNAVSTKTWPIGTKLYVVETKAPYGYKLDATAHPITLKSDSAQNQVEIADVPVFGSLPNLIKVDKDNTTLTLAGAVFKYSYYMNTDGSGEPAREWYFKTQSNGTLDLTKVADGYTSSELFDINTVPLGTVKVQEIEAPVNYHFAPGVEDFVDTWHIDYLVDTTNSVSHWADNPNRPVEYIHYILDATGDMEWGNEIDSKPITLEKGILGLYTALTPKEREIVQNSEMYSLEGAEYRVYLDHGDNFDYDGCDEYTTLITGEGGKVISDKEWPIHTELVIKEYKAPKGYKKDNTLYRLTISPKSEDNVVYPKDEPIFGEMPRIVKKDKSNGDRLANAVFSYTYYASETVKDEAKYGTWYFISNNNGNVNFDEDFLYSAEGYTSTDLWNRVPLGTVVIKEEIAPSEYELSDVTAEWLIRQNGNSAKCRWNKTDSTGALEYEYEDHQNLVAWNNVAKVYGFSIKKIDDVTGLQSHMQEGQKLEARFKLYVNSDKVWFDGYADYEAGWYTKDQEIGSFSIEDLQTYTSPVIYRAGEYRIEEVEGSQPINYHVMSDAIVFTVNEDTTLPVQVCEEHPYLNSVSLKKVDAYNGLAQHFNPELDFTAKFTFEYTGEKAITIMVNTVNEDGSISREKKTFVKDDPATEVNEGMIYDNIVIHAGETWVSPQELPTGSYKFVETEAPYGYAKCEDIEVTINDNTEECYEFTCEEERLYGGVSLIKLNDLYDEATTENHDFNGIKFDIISNNDFESEFLKGLNTKFNKGDVVLTIEVHWNSSTSKWEASTRDYVDGNWSNDIATGYKLLPGSYIIKEVTTNEHGAANDSYFADERSIEFTVTPEKIETLATDGDPIVAYDKPVRGKLSFQKLSQSKYPVEGVPYLLTNTTTGEQHIIVTGADGWFHSNPETAFDAESVNLNDAIMGEGWLKDAESGLYTLNTKELRIKADDLKVGGVWFFVDESGTDTIRVDLAEYGALPMGHYVLQELYAEANYGLDSALNHEEFDITNEELLTGETQEIALSEDQTIIDAEHIEISTNAWNAELALGHHMVIVGAGENKIIDTVSVNADGIVPGYQYRLTALLHSHYFDGQVLEGITGQEYFSYDTIQDILDADAADGELDGIVHIDVVISMPDDFYDVLVNGEEISIDLEGRYTYISETCEVLAFNPIAETEEDKYVWEVRAEHDNPKDTSQWVLFPKIRTQAWDSETKDHISRETIGEDFVTWVDTLGYEAIWDGYEVLIKTWLVDSETGEPLVIDGQPVAVEGRFVADGFSGSFDIPVELKTEGLHGKTYTFMEEVYAIIEDGEGGYKEVLIGEHKDKDDVDQQIQIPEGHTTAWGVDEDTHMVQVGEKSKLSDRFFYNNLVVGKEYELPVKLMDKLTGKEINLESAEFYFDGVKAEGNTGKFVPTAKEGSVLIEVIFDSRELAGSQTVFFERVRYEGIDIIIHENLDDEDQTVNLIDIRTLAHFDEGMKYIQAGETVKWYDEVNYIGLEVGREYTIRTKIAFVPTKAEYEAENYKVKFLKEDGILEVTFTPEEPNGSIIVETEVDTSKLGGKAFVFFEYLYTYKEVEDEEGNKTTEEVEIATHEDEFDEGQTVRVLDMHTKAVSAATGSKILELGKSVKLKDIISNFGFPIGEEFKWVGYVYDAVTGKPIEQNGKPIMLEWTGKLTSPDQEIEMVFTIDTTVLEGKKLTIVEEVYNKDGKKILEHNKDLKDEDQTVTVDVTPPKTGDDHNVTPYAIMAIIAGIMLAIGATVLVRRKKVCAEKN